MLQNNTIEKLHEMHLGAFAQAFQRQMKDSAIAELSFEDRVSMLVDAEWTSRRNNKLKRLMRKAEFEYPGASLEDIEYRADCGLDKELIARLSTCSYVNECRNIILLGATGSGKTFLANAFGVKAAQNFCSVRYVRLPEPMIEMALARAEGTYPKLLKLYRQVNLLILDEWLLYPLKDLEARDLLEIAEGRYKRASTIFCSPFEVGGWHDKIGDALMADSICDRIVHDSYTVVIGGKDSMRKVKGLPENEA
jgi:DNA replication protein DnaC